MRARLRGALLGAALALVVACARGDQTSTDKPTRAVGTLIVHPPAGPPPQARAADTNKADQAKLARLEQEARALAKTDGCKSLGSCSIAAVGWRGCGGPRSYLAFCAATTDTVALFRKLAELEAAEEDYNAKTGMVSTCEMRLPPRVAVGGGRCRLESARP